MREETSLPILQTLKKNKGIRIVNSFMPTKFSNSDEIEKFLERHKLPELIHQDK